jgi:hypothetical protein
MKKELPARPNVEHLKSQAKDLLEAVRRGDAEALARVRASLPSGVVNALHDAQSVIAREYGFASWKELRDHVDKVLSPETIRALVGAPLPPEIMEALASAASRPIDPVPLDEALPLVGVRNALVAVGAVAPLHLGRNASIEAVKNARDGAVVLFTQRDPANEDPAEEDLHPVGAAARVLRTFPVDAGLAIVVRATQWVRLEGIDRRGGYAAARVVPFVVAAGDPAEVARLERELRTKASVLVSSSMPNPEPLLRRLEQMKPGELADAVIANIPCPVEAKARYAAEPNLVARLAYVLALFDRAA